MSNSVSTPSEIYNYVLNDNAQTPADDIAKHFGFRSHNQILQAIGKHILAEMQKGNMISYPKMNISLPTAKRSRGTNITTRSNSDAKLQVGANKLGEFDNVSSFEILTKEIDGEQMLVFKPLSRFENTSNNTSSTSGKSQSNSTNSTVNNTSNTVESGSNSTNSSTDNNSEEVTSNPAPELVAAIPASSTPISQIPEVTVDEEDDEFALNANMI
jgi:hypothetical protein